MPLVLLFTSKYSHEEQGVELNDPYGCLPTGGILWFCDPGNSIFTILAC